MALYYLLTTAVSSVFYGVLAAAVLMGVIYVGLYLLNSGIVKSIPFYVTGGVLAILLTVQFSLMIGAFEADNVVDSAEQTIRQVTENASNTLRVNDSQQLLEKIKQEYPVVGIYIGVCDISGTAVQDIAGAVTQTMHDYLSDYIWRRIFWIAGFTIVACAIAIVFRERENNYTIDMDADLGIY